MTGLFVVSRDIISRTWLVDKVRERGRIGGSVGGACVTLQILCPGCIVQLQEGGHTVRVTGAVQSG